MLLLAGLAVAVGAPPRVLAQTAGSPCPMSAACLEPGPWAGLLGAAPGPTVRETSSVGAPRRQEPEPDRGALAVALSAVVPGSGQLLLGQRRWMAYGALEVAGWWLWADRRGEARTLRGRYRDLAWTEARSPLWDGERVDGDFDYYERMGHWTRSGSYDRDPEAEGVQPETDETTYNGFIWGLARDLHFKGGSGGEPGPGDPAYAEALAYYQDRAYPAQLLWDWSGTPDGLERYNGLIRDSDDHFREARLFLGAVIANHFLSTVDAFISHRLRSSSGASVETTTRLVLPSVAPALPGRGSWPGGPRLDLTLRFRPPGDP